MVESKIQRITAVEESRIFARMDVWPKTYFR